MATTENYRTSSTVAGARTVQRVSWGAIIAGAVIAIALMTLFTLFGVGIGAAIIDPQYDQNPGDGMSITAMIYLIITQLVALGAGGFVAARMAGIPRTISSLLHGASVWAVTTVFMAWASVVGVGAMFGAAGSLLSGTASSVASVGEAMSSKQCCATTALLRKIYVLRQKRRSAMYLASVNKRRLWLKQKRLFEIW